MQALKLAMGNALSSASPEQQNTKLSWLWTSLTDENQLVVQEALPSILTEPHCLLPAPSVDKFSSTHRPVCNSRINIILSEQLAVIQEYETPMEVAIEVSNDDCTFHVEKHKCYALLELYADTPVKFKGDDFTVPTLLRFYITKSGFSKIKQLIRQHL